MGANADLVLATWRSFLAGDVKAAFANLHDDATWTIPGLIPGLSGTKRGKAEIVGFLRGVVKIFPQGLRSEVKKVHEAGNTVVVELTNRSTTAAGKPYENEYCFVWELDGGKVRAIREYVDTEKAAAIIAGG
jgi:uncharacterized protein